MNLMNENSQFVTKSEFCKICGISSSTAYKLIKNGRISKTECCDRLLHYYKIPIEEIENYRKEQEKKNREALSEHEVTVISKYYRAKMKDYPDVIESKDIQNITGYGKEIIRVWINSEKILGVVVRKRFKVAKEDLIDFLVTPYYFNIIRKSKTHIDDFTMIGLI